MKKLFSVEDAVKTRYSVRTYDNNSLDASAKEKLIAYAEGLTNPLGPGIKIQFIEKELSSNGEKLGTYGVIKGAKSYIAVIMQKKEYAEEALGYEFEELVLYAAHLGLGTCWLGGTFNRSAFSENVALGENEVFAFLSPVGRKSHKNRMGEQLFRRTLKADDRKPWQELFFKGDLNIPLAKEDAGEYCFPLEMLRRAPSAVNKQPWLVVMTDKGFHFYEKKTYAGEGIDMQRVDVGICVCHFHLAAMEKGLAGHFEKCCPDIAVPDDTVYITSWIFE